MYKIKSWPCWSKNLITIAIIALNLTLIVSAFSLLAYWTHYSVLSINLASKQQDLYQNQWMFWVGFVLFILSIPSSIGSYFLISELIDDCEEISLFCHIIFGLKILLLAAMVVIYLTLLITTSMLIYHNNHNNLSGYNSLLIAVLVISIFNLISIWISLASFKDL